MDNLPETQASQLESRHPPRRTLTHLFVGTLAFGLDALSQRLQEWDGLAAEQRVDAETVSPAAEGVEPVQGLVLQPGSVESPSDSARYALVGMLFNAQDRLSKGLSRADRLTRRLYAGSARLFEPLSSSPLAAPFTRRWQRLVLRGELQVSDWVERGRVEEQAGVVIARQAVEGTTGDVIEVLAEHPGMKELVEKQSTGFANEIVEEIRERTVSLDTLFERISRRILHKPPRPLLTSPGQARSAESSSKTIQPKADNY